VVSVCAVVVGACLISGCPPSYYRRQADQAATGILKRERADALGQDEPLTVEQPVDTLRRQLMIDQDLPRCGAVALGTDQLEPIEHWPEKDYPAPSAPETKSQARPSFVELTLVESLQVAAANSRAYQTRKEDVYREALDLDLASDEFRHTFAGVLDGLHTQNNSHDGTVRGTEYGGAFDWTKQFKTGAEITAGLALDLAHLISSDRGTALGILADASLTVPLMRGAGRHIVTEPLTQAQRDVVYALYALERFKRTLAVQVASEYLAVLQQIDRVENQQRNYERLLAGTRRVQRLAQAGRLPEIQVDQARQDALRARDNWVAAVQNYTQRLDRFKITLGLPTDAVLELDRSELKRLAELAEERMPAAPEPPPATQPGAADAPVIIVQPSREDGGPLELPPQQAVEIALVHRLDLQTVVGGVYDAQRDVVVAANALEMGLSLTATGQAGARRTLGTVGAGNASVRPEHGVYTFGFELDLPLERTAEQNAYRDSYIALERSVRGVQELEDQIKLEVRNALRTLLQARESYRIQLEAVALAERRVDSTALFLQAGRAEVRDVLEAQEDLVNAQNALTAALVDYRVAELNLQRDMGVLQVSDDGLWHEFDPTDIK